MSSARRLPIYMLPFVVASCAEAGPASNTPAAGASPTTAVSASPVETSMSGESAAPAGFASSAPRAEGEVAPEARTGQVAPEARTDEVAPAPAAPVLDLDASGCFAWSAQELTAACVQSTSSIAGGCIDDLVFIGSGAKRRYRIVDKPPQCLDAPTPALPKADRGVVEARMKTFEKLPPPAATLGPGDKKAVGELTIAFERKKTGHVSLTDGSWDVFGDSIVMTCKGKRRTVMSIKVENALEPSVAVVDTGTRWLLLSYRATWGVEGDIGSRADVAAVDRDSCEIVRP